MALDYVTEAFAEAQLDGLARIWHARTAIFAASQEFVATYGEGSGSGDSPRLARSHPRRRFLGRTAPLRRAARVVITRFHVRF